MADQKPLAILHIRQEAPGTEQTIPITKSPFNIGRVGDNDLSLASGRISRYHARLLLEGDQMSLIDLNSSNGTFIGQSRLSPNLPTPLTYGQLFTIGEYIMQLEALPAESVAAAAPKPAAKPAPLAPASREPAMQIKTDPGTPSRPGLTPPAQPPAEPPGLSPTRPEVPPSYDAGFGLPQDNSRYLQYLPPIYGEYPFLGSFLLAFEGVLTPLEQIVDNFDLYLDPRTTPAFFMGQLAHWLSLTIDEKWPLAKQRAILAEAAELYRRRGTRWSLIRYLEIYTGLTAEINEPDKRPHFFEVTLRIPKGQTVDRATVERIIRASKPAHTIYNLKLVQQ